MVWIVREFRIHWAAGARDVHIEEGSYRAFLLKVIRLLCLYKSHI
jgi:hypothetical protein